MRMLDESEENSTAIPMKPANHSQKSKEKA
jgi:hypothetical protein